MFEGPEFWDARPWLRRRGWHLEPQAIEGVEWSYRNQYDAFNNRPFDMNSDHEYSLIVETHDKALQELATCIAVLMARNLVRLKIMNAIHMWLNPIQKLIYRILGMALPERHDDTPAFDAMVWKALRFVPIRPDIFRQVVLLDDLKSDGKISYRNPLFPDRDGPFPEAYQATWS